MVSDSNTRGVALAEILIVRLSAIGDCVHAVPVVDALRRALPQANIGWAIQGAGAEVVRSLGAADRYHLFPREARGIARWRALARFRRELRSQRYDVAIDLQGNGKSGLVARLSGARRRIGLPRRERRELNQLFVELPKPTPGSLKAPTSHRGEDGSSTDVLHVIERNLQVLEQLGIDTAQRPATFARPRFDAGRGPAARGVVLCPSTTWVTKIWPAESYAALAARLANLGCDVEVFWGGEREHHLAAEIVATSQQLVDIKPVDGRGVGRITSAPSLELGQLASFFSSAKLVVGNDSGPVHLAAALGVPCVGVYGATDPQRNGLYWPTTRSLWVEDEDLDCRPCWRRSCARGDLACLRRLEVERVLAACREVDPKLLGPSPS